MPAEALQAAVDAILQHIASLETPQERARAATDFIAHFEDGKRSIAIARVAAVAELLADNWTMTRVARELDLSLNAVVQIRNEHQGRRRRR